VAVTKPEDVWLCLGGGNALGAYHAGAYQALHDAGIAVSRISGASIGAIVGAIIAGNPPDRRQARLDEFWTAATEKLTITNVYSEWPSGKIAAALGTLLFGRAGLFHPAHLQWFKRLIGLNSPSLFERQGLRQTLQRLVDFELLNSGNVRFMANAVDVQSGEQVIFDNAADTLTVDHLLATSAFPVLYPPERAENRVFVDGGLASNLPLAPLFRDAPNGEVTCLAFDLLSLAGDVPASLDDALRRAQQLLLGWQSRQTLELLRTDLRSRRYPVRILHVCYDGMDEVGGMTLDYSLNSMKTRYESGRRDGARSVEWIARVRDTKAGFRIDRLNRTL
jgi:NTE family protein